MATLPLPYVPQVKNLGLGAVKTWTQYSRLAQKLHYFFSRLPLNEPIENQQKGAFGKHGWTGLNTAVKISKTILKTKEDNLKILSLVPSQ